MKFFTLLFSLTFLPFLIFSQQTINGSIAHDNLNREYILYIPDNYTGDEPVPLIFNFHGFGSNANEQMWYGDFRSIADTAGFIIVHPEGTLFSGNAHFNVGGFTTGSTIDDVGFSIALLDSIAADYNINLDRVYSTGMSNGGYMSFLLACQASDRFAAVASVTGSMTPETYNNCDPQHPTPILQIHGTDDSVVPYGGEAWTKSIDEVMQYWVDHNNCNNTPTINSIPNINTSDQSTVEHFIYAGGDNGSTAEHFKITAGDHTWAGTVFNFPGTNYDIDASAEIWKFFSRYDINGSIESTNTFELEKLDLKIYPNPTSSFVFIENNFSATKYFEVFSLMGKRMQSGILNANQHEIDLSAYPDGAYFLKIENRSYKMMKLGNH